ncbi:odorant receptor 30a-like isoform X2 [Cylas formicarius]|uniref:odorant receptor 30a-like isoform X2 n=1 Tax=Cylas formicarius TaxID=197179 RepID=UPI00295850DD|nr:odorant receptor 30a-like isoform X2 [Cylas formicarius]
MTTTSKGAFLYIYPAIVLKALTQVRHNYFRKMSERMRLFHFAKLSMTVVCMWRLDRPPLSKFANLMYQLYSVVLRAILCSVPALMAVNFPSLLNSDPNSAIEGASKMLYCMILVVKAYSYQSNKCRDLLAKATEEESSLYDIDDDDVTRIYKEHVRFCHMLSKLFYISSILSSSTLCAIAIVNSYKFSKIVDGVGEKPTPLLFWYPFDKNRYHIWVMVHQFISILVASCYVLPNNVYYNSVMIYVRSRLRILQHYFRNYPQYALSGRLTTLQMLNVLCVKHQDLINYINDVNCSVRDAVFFEYNVISVILATILYQVVQGQDTLFNSIFAFVVCIQLMILAWTSDEIALQSSSLGAALYESKWFDQSQESKVLIGIMMMGCRKPLSISIGPFGPMTMLSAMSRLKLAYSYMSVMTS